MRTQISIRISATTLAKLGGVQVVARQVLVLEYDTVTKYQQTEKSCRRYLYSCRE